MTVTTTESNNTWIADGSTNEFSFTFPILDESNLLVKKRNYSGVLVNMVLGIDYTVTGIGNLPERTNYKSGKITFLRNIQLESIIIIERNIPKTQEIDYVENTELPAQGHEEALDKITMALQELNADSKKAVTLAPDVENIIPEISNVKPDDFLKIAPDGSGITGIEIDDQSYNTGAINSISQDNSPTLSNTLNTNGHDIQFESDHGLVNSADNPILTVKYDDQNTSHLEIDTTKEHQQPIIRATSDNENTNLMLEAKGNGSITTLNNLNALQGISVTGTIQATDNENDDADLVLNSKGSGNTIIDDVPIVNEINTAKNAITTLENKVTNTEINIGKTENSISIELNKFNTLENKASTIEESNIPDMENNIATALNKVNAIENNVTTALNKINDLENNITAIDNNIQTYDKKIDTTNDTINIIKNSVTASSTKINALENTVNNLENTVTTSSNKVNNMESELTNINADIKKIENDIKPPFPYSSHLAAFRKLYLMMKLKDHGVILANNTTIYKNVKNDYFYEEFLIIKRKDNYQNIVYVEDKKQTGKVYDMDWRLEYTNRHENYNSSGSQAKVFIDDINKDYVKLGSNIRGNSASYDDIEIFTSYTSHPEKPVVIKTINENSQNYTAVGIPGESNWQIMVHMYTKNHDSCFGLPMKKYPLIYHHLSSNWGDEINCRE